jgi:hypothetical protein
MTLQTRLAMPLIDEPKADEDLRFRVRLFLQQRGHRPLQQLEVEASSGVVTLRGTVPSFYLRQHALACVRHVAGILRVIDEMETALSLPVNWAEDGEAAGDARDSAPDPDIWRA